MSKAVIDILRDDKEYYRGVGKEYLSNSDIDDLIKNPKMFGVPNDESLPFLKGRYFHQAILEPEKIKDYEIVDASTRTTKIYKEAKEASGEDILLLQKEVDEINAWVDAMKSNMDFFDMIYTNYIAYEEPAVGEIHGKMWKGKADIVKPGYLIDLKTTREINGFRWNAKKYNYDSQAYIYQQLFGKPLYFLVVDKDTCQIGVFRPSESFLESGEDKVKRAIENYEKFFGKNATQNVEDFYFDEVLT